MKVGMDGIEDACVTSLELLIVVQLFHKRRRTITVPLFQTRYALPDIIHRRIALKTQLHRQHLQTADFRRSNSSIDHGRRRHDHRPPALGVALLQHGESEYHLGDGDEDGYYDEHDDDPGDVAHLAVGDAVRQDLCEVEENAAALVEDLYARVYLEVFAYSGVEGV